MLGYDGKPTLSIKEASQLLWEKLRLESWFTAIGLTEVAGVPHICIYAQSLAAFEKDPKCLRFLFEGWEGHKVMMKEMGRPTVEL